MNRENAIICFCLAFLLGVGFCSELILDNLFFYLAGLGFILLIYSLWEKKVGWRLWLVFGFGLIFGLLRMGLDVYVGGGNLADFNGVDGVLEFNGKVVAEPRFDANSQSMFLAVNELEIGGLKKVVGGLAKLKLNRYPQLEWGDRLVIKGKLVAPENTEKFKYADFLSKDRVFSVINNPQILKLDKSCWALDCFERAMIWWRNVIVDKFLQIFNEPVAGIVAGILIGVRSTIPVDILSDFQTTGLTHILAISGFNITLIINVISVLLVNFSKVKRFWISFVLIVVFVFLTGCSSSVVRAALMGLLILLVKTIGRKSNVIIVIMVSALLMVFVSPRILAFDISFQLSFFATLSLICFSEHFEKVGLSWPNLIREGIMVTITAQVLTLPISFYNFGKISLISPIANLLILPLVPAIMLLGFITFLIAWPSLLLAKWLGGATWLITIFMIKSVNILAKIPLAAIEVGKGFLPLVLIYYLLIFKFFHKSKPEPDFLLESVLLDQSISSQES